MTSQNKYDTCLSLLSEMHDIIYVMIETGVDGDVTALQLIEESINVLKSVENGVSPSSTYMAILPDKKDKKILH